MPENRPEDRTARQAGRGRTADQPSEFPWTAWRDIALRVKREFANDQLSLLAAGIAFYGLLALFPGLAVLVSVYAMLSDAATVADHVNALAMVPQGVRDLVREQLVGLSRASETTVGASLLGGFLLSLWSASKALRALVSAMNVAYDETETRGWLHRTILGLSFTLVSITAGFFALLVIAALPAAFEQAGWGLMALALPWIVTLLAFAGWLAMLYRYGPSRADARWRWITPGSIAATLIWLLGSVGFSAYVAHFGRYNDTYGSMGATVVLLLWFWLSAWAVLLGAELNAEMEHQTAEDTTTGGDQPRGQRDAYVADHVGDAPD
ncbi:MAG: YihY/virulence factor BrkB family protein [Polyangiales bacterium]